MGIFGALTTAVSGMRAQAFALENISGNIANSQTTAFKRTDTSFVDLIPDAIPSQQLAGNVVAHSSATNTVQGGIQSASVSTFMAINGQGFFVVEKPDSFVDNRPSFSGVDLYSRRGDFQVDQNGYLVNGAGYYLMGIPVDSTTGNLAGSVPQLLQFQNGFLPAQPTTNIDYRANLASYPLTTDHNIAVPGSELLNQANFSANPVAGVPAAAKIIGSGATLSPDVAATLTGAQVLTSLSSAGGTLNINSTPITINAGDNMAAIMADINGATGTTGVTATLDGTNHLVLTSADARVRKTPASTRSWARSTCAWRSNWPRPVSDSLNVAPAKPAYWHKSLNYHNNPSSRSTPTRMLSGAWHAYISLPRGDKTSHQEQKKSGSEWDVGQN